MHEIKKNRGVVVMLLYDGIFSRQETFSSNQKNKIDCWFGLVWFSFGCTAREWQGDMILKQLFNDELSKQCSKTKIV